MAISVKTKLDNGKTQRSAEAKKITIHTNSSCERKNACLTLKEPLRFIFSHSALREGWDNPNVFQICTLNEIASTEKKRQQIGRGLRLPVNTHGERVHDKNINCLTVVANESYEKFASSLQTEIEKDYGIIFGRLEKTCFAQITLRKDGKDYSNRTRGV